jgi:LysM repeat protein
MKYFYLLPLGLAFLTVSCKSTKTASTNPYSGNPYYGSTGSAADYSSTPSSANYPSYTESTYTPPASVSGGSVPSVPSVPTYNQPTAPSYTGGSKPSPYSGGSVGSGGGSGSGSGGSHTVANGENLYRISLKHGTSVAAIKSANGLTSDTIRAGQVLRIP